jgi:aldehyde dehydrogenase (NAD+)
VIISTNPLDEQDVLAESPALGAQEVAKAATAARDAQTAWAADNAGRAAALHRAAAELEQHAAELAALVVREVGKPVVEAEGEVARTVALLRFHAQAALAPAGEVVPPADGRGLLLTRKAPRGLVGLVTPYNFPLAIPAWKAAPALALGNAVLLKPSPLALATGERFVELVSRHLPAGVLTCCPGGAETGEALIDVVDALSFTGSTAAGKAVAVAAAARQLPVQTENGGHNSAIVLPDVDVATVAAVVARDVVGFAGQKCTSTRRALVVGDADAFAEALLAAMAALPVGDPTSRDTVAGPLVSAAAASGVERSIEACGPGAVRVPVELGAPYVAPALVRDDAGSTLAAREEVFGPVVVVQQVSDVDEAVSVAHAVPARLVGAVHTRDLDRALDVAQRLRAGMVRVNAPSTGVDLHAAFGGEGDSGYGPREQGRAADALFTVERTITIRP